MTECKVYKVYSLGSSKGGMFIQLLKYFPMRVMRLLKLQDQNLPAMTSHSIPKKDTINEGGFGKYK